MTKFFISIILVALISTSESFSQNLENLHFSKKRVKEYYSSGMYENDMKRIIDSAITEIEKIKLKENSAVVFDVDETTLSNMQYELEYDFGFNQSSWNEWLSNTNAIAIPQSKRFYDYLINKGIKIIFLTGRSDKYYKPTYDNLIKEKYSKFDTLICKSKEFVGKKAAIYKSSIREELSKKYEIIASVGDQFSDFEGGYTILKIKLPNFIYWIE